MSELLIVGCYMGLKSPTEVALTRNRKATSLDTLIQNVKLNVNQVYKVNSGRQGVRGYQ